MLKLEMQGLKGEIGRFLNRVRQRYDAVQRRDRKATTREVEKMSRSELTLAKAMGDVDE